VKEAKISVVVPMHNESGNVAVLVDRIGEVLQTQKYRFELVLVDDGSQDDTWSSICKKHETVPEIRGIKLSRNFGHQYALLAGLSVASGDAVISMDADMQHPPETLPELIEKWERGSKVVYTRRCQQHNISAFKRKTSDWFYSVFSWLSGVTIEPGSSDFRLLDRQVLEQLLEFNDVSPFFRGAVRWLGFDDSSTTVEYALGDRHSGESTYTLGKMLQFANSGIISFSTKPLILGIWLGLFTSFVAFLELAYILVQYFLGNTVQGWASAVGITALLFGVLFVLLGIIGLYLARIHTALQGRPKFIVDQKVGNEHTGQGTGTVDQQDLLDRREEFGS